MYEKKNIFVDNNPPHIVSEKSVTQSLWLFATICQKKRRAECKENVLQTFLTNEPAGACAQIKQAQQTSHFHSFQK